MNKEAIYRQQAASYKLQLDQANMRINELVEERAKLIVNNMKLSQEIDNLRDLISLEADKKGRSFAGSRKRDKHVRHYQTIQQMKPELWPDESRINAIGQNGNTGEHYDEQ